MTSARPQRTDAVGFAFCEVPRVLKTIDRKEDGGRQGRGGEPGVSVQWGQSFSLARQKSSGDREWGMVVRRCDSISAT